MSWWSTHTRVQVQVPYFQDTRCSLKFDGPLPGRGYSSSMVRYRVAVIGLGISGIQVRNTSTRTHNTPRPAACCSTRKILLSSDLPSEAPDPHEYSASLQYALFGEFAAVYDQRRCGVCVQHATTHTSPLSNFNSEGDFLSVYVHKKWPLFRFSDF